MKKILMVGSCFGIVFLLAIATEQEVKRTSKMTPFQREVHECRVGMYDTLKNKLMCLQWCREMFESVPETHKMCKQQIMEEFS